MDAPSHAPRRRRIALAAVTLTAFVGVWVAMSLIGAAFHRATWIHDPSGERSALAAGGLRPVANAMNLAAKPGWVIVVRVGPRHYEAVRTERWVLRANMLAWGGYVVAIAFAWLVWRAWYTAQRRFPFVRPRREGTDLSRRSVLLHGVGGVVALGSAGSVAKATMLEPMDLRVRRFDVPIRDLPEAFDGLRIAVIADTHLGPFVAPSLIRHAVRMTLDLKPDLIALVGDYSHHDTREIELGASIFAPLCEPGAAGFGVVGVLGNHDWFSGAHATREALRAIGVRLVENMRVYLDPETMSMTERDPGDAAMCVAGVGDLDHGDVSIARALGGVREGVPRVLLSHNPDVSVDPMLARRGETTGRGYRADLMLCGHTHGGQVRLPLIGAPIVPVRTGQRFAEGLNQGPACPVVTTRGVGMSILPVRFGVPPEVVEVRLTRASGGSTGAVARVVL